MTNPTLPRRQRTNPVLVGATLAWLQLAAVPAHAVDPPVADRANFRGDCLRLTTPIKAEGNGLPADATLLYVVSQTDDGKMLNVVKGDAWLDGAPGFGGLFCGPADETHKTEVSTISVKDVIDSGARRRGLVYGMLLTPYKYYPHSRQLVGAASIGPYIGTRTEFAQGALSLVVSAGMGNVTGISTDAKGATKEVSLASLSLAAGAIFEISKSKNPFRLGVLVGTDRVRPGTRVTYENNGKTWVALQLGYDFTDY